MKYKPYPKYKDSGVEWLGEIPEGWRCKRLRFLVKFNPSKTEIGQFHPDVVSFLPMDNISDDGSLRLDITRNWEDVESGYSYFSEGDVTYAIITPCFENGKGAQMLGLTSKIGFGTTELCVLRPSFNCDGRWLWYITISNPFRKLGESWMYGAGGQKRVPDNFARDYSVGFPHLPTQRAIAAFLDTETARIDGLIKDYEELIELLKEKRQALISHAVTRGLSELVSPDDPDFGEWAKPVKFKDSGVEWIGKIPEGWEIKKLKYISPKICVGIVVNPSDYISEEGLPFIYGGDIKESKINSESARLISNVNSAKNTKTKLELGDLLTVRVGAPGVTAVVDDSCVGGNCASVMLTKHGDFISNWLCYQFNSRIIRYQIELVQYGAAQEQFNISHAVDFLCSTPKQIEQHAIASFLDKETSKIDTLISESESAIELLKEHRSALITNAVTGKINVEASA